MSEANPKYPPVEGEGMAFWFTGKKTNENAPDAKATFLFHGELVEIAMWKREAKPGQKPWSAVKFRVGPPRHVAPEPSREVVSPPLAPPLPDLDDTPLGKNPGQEIDPNDLF